VKPGPDYLEKPNVIKRMGTLYAEVNTEKWTELAFTGVFCVRRVLFVIVILQPVAFIRIPLLQLFGLLQLCYYLHVKPFKDDAMAGIEAFNELMILLALHCLHWYSNFVQDVEVKFSMGIVFCIIVIIPLFAVNLTRAIYAGVHKPCLKCRRKCKKKKV
jgi:hypothetical protein